MFAGILIRAKDFSNVCDVIWVHQGRSGGLHESIRPVFKTLIAVARSSAVSASCILQPPGEWIFILIEHKKLSEEVISLVKSFGPKSLTMYLSDSCNMGDGFLTHRLRNKVLMLFWRHNSRAPERSRIVCCFCKYFHSPSQKFTLSFRYKITLSW